MKTWTTLLGIVSGLIIAVAGLIVTIFGYVKPKEDQRRLREETAILIKQELAIEKRNLENFSFALANLAQGNIALVDSSVKDASAPEREARRKDAFDCFSLSLLQLTTVTTTYGNLESLYTHALNGILQGSAIDGECDTTHLQRIHAATDFLEREPMWSKHSRIIGLVSEVRKKVFFPQGPLPPTPK